MVFVYRICQNILVFPYWFASFIWYRIHILGRENLQGVTGPVILVCNHKSYIDHFLVAASLPHWWRSPLMPIQTMTLDVFFSIPVLKHLFRIIGTFPANKGKGYDVSLAPLIAALKKGGVVGVYPEGGVGEGEPGLFRRGVAELAHRSGAPVLPIAVCGTENTDFHALPRAFESYAVIFGRPFVPANNDSPESTAEEIRMSVLELYRNGLKTYSRYLQRPAR